MTSPYEIHLEAMHARHALIGVPYLREMVGMSRDERDTVEKETGEYLADCDEAAHVELSGRIEHLYASANTHESFSNREVDVFARALLTSVDLLPVEISKEVSRTVLRARYMNPASMTRADFPFSEEKTRRLLFGR